MSSWRETSVLRKTLKSLNKEHPELFRKLSDNEIVQTLLKKPEPTIEPNPEDKSKVALLNDLLGKAIHRLRFYKLENLDPQLLLKELEKTYIIAAENYLKCRINPKPSAIHEFRKRAKDFLYQLYFFRPLNPVAIKDLEKRLDDMTQNLGKFNDLTQILIMLDYKDEEAHNQEEIQELAVLIRDRQDVFLSKVWPQAYKIFCPGQKLINLLGFRLLVI
jgi:CHAD domain-containing protein